MAREDSAQEFPLLQNGASVNVPVAMESAEVWPWIDFDSGGKFSPETLQERHGSREVSLAAADSPEFSAPKKSALRSSLASLSSVVTTPRGTPRSSTVSQRCRPLWLLAATLSRVAHSTKARFKVLTLPVVGDEFEDPDVRPASELDLLRKSMTDYALGFLLVGIFLLLTPIPSPYSAKLLPPGRLSSSTLGFQSKEVVEEWEHLLFCICISTWWILFEVVKRSGPLVPYAWVLHTVLLPPLSYVVVLAGNKMTKQDKLLRIIILLAADLAIYAPLTYIFFKRQVAGYENCLRHLRGCLVRSVVVLPLSFLLAVPVWLLRLPFVKQHWWASSIASTVVPKVMGLTLHFVMDNWIITSHQGEIGHAASMSVACSDFLCKTMALKATSHHVIVATLALQAVTEVICGLAYAEVMASHFLETVEHAMERLAGQSQNLTSDKSKSYVRFNFSREAEPTVPAAQSDWAASEATRRQRLSTFGLLESIADSHAVHAESLARNRFESVLPVQESDVPSDAEGPSVTQEDVVMSDIVFEMRVYNLVERTLIPLCVAMWQVLNPSTHNLRTAAFQLGACIFFESLGDRVFWACMWLLDRRLWPRSRDSFDWRDYYYVGCEQLSMAFWFSCAHFVHQGICKS